MLDGPATPILERMVAARGVLEGEIGHLKRRMRHGERRDLAMDQRRDPLSDFDRRPAGGIGRIASQPVNPVYPRQHGKRAAQRPGGGGNETAAAHLIIRLGRQSGHSR